MTNQMKAETISAMLASIEMHEKTITDCLLYSRNYGDALEFAQNARDRLVNGVAKLQAEIA
jgi:hypothetical protein